MAPGVTSQLWEIGDIVDVLETWEGHSKLITESRMKWEYHFYPGGSGRDFEQAGETMNNLGRTGWELVTTYTDPAGRPVFVFKRPLPESK
jgi:hypothetical protein